MRRLLSFSLQFWTEVSARKYLALLLFDAAHALATSHLHRPLCRCKARKPSASAIRLGDVHLGRGLLLAAPSDLGFYSRCDCIYLCFLQEMPKHGMVCQPLTSLFPKSLTLRPKGFRCCRSIDQNLRTPPANLLRICAFTQRMFSHLSRNRVRDFCLVSCSRSRECCMRCLKMRIEPQVPCEKTPESPLP